MTVHLSQRESETLGWLAQGKTYWEMGRIMGISRHGVDKRMRVLKEKFGVATEIQVVAEAFRRDLVA